MVTIAEYVYKRIFQKIICKYYVYNTNYQLNNNSGMKWKFSSIILSIELVTNHILKVEEVASVLDITVKRMITKPMLYL